MTAIIPFLRNLIAATATFIVVAVLIMMATQTCIKLTIGQDKITHRHEVIILVVSIIVAALLTPFYYLPY